MGIGSKLKRAVRKIIPNELAEVASAAAPFVAPFNPAVAAAMAGLGSFDKTGRIGQSVKAGIGTYALGQGARFLGGAGFQDPSFSAFTPSGFQAGFSSPFGTETGIGKFLAPDSATGLDAVAQQQTSPGAGFREGYDPGTLPSVTEAAAGATEAVSPGLLESFKSAKGFDKMKVVYNFMTDPKNKMIVSALGGGAAAVLQYLENKAREKDQLDLTLGPQLGYMGDLRGTNPRFTMAKEGGIIGLANGGEPAMEMDYRGGGFIPVGAKERADDVPARLSKNEFVMTADAVRAAGGGSVDVGAQRMYDLMNRLEAQA
mgnify:FL=1